MIEKMNLREDEKLYRAPALEIFTISECVLTASGEGETDPGYRDGYIEL